MPSPPRPLHRSPSWPTTLHLATHGNKTFVPEPHSMSAGPTTSSKPSQDSFFQDDLEDHPEDHFLSPMYEYEDWASDSEDDDEVEWDAGITDFALFNNDRQRAQQTDEQLDERWDVFMQRQDSALRRSIQRSHSEAEVDTTRPPLPFDEVPGLTPDSSPHLRDDLDVESFHGQDQARPSVPNYLTVTVTPPSPEQQVFEDDDDLPLSFALHHSQSMRPARRKMERPGLRHARTMSGKLHSWRRPGWNMYSLGEEPEAEKKAEQGSDGSQDDLSGVRGRRGCDARD